MKFILLESIIEGEASFLKRSAAFKGYDDRESDKLLFNLKEFKDTLIHKNNLKPYENHKLYDFEVGEPQQFFDVIDKFNREIEKSRELNLKEFLLENYQIQDYKSETLYNNKGNIIGLNISFIQ